MTPETDAAVKASNGQWSFVLKETCQRLERERNKAREAVSAVKYYLTKERDDALSKIVQAEFRAEQFHQERDEAREALMKIEEIFIDGGDTYLDFVRVGNIATDYLEGL